MEACLMTDFYMVAVFDSHGCFYSDPEFPDTLQEAKEMKAKMEEKGTADPSDLPKQGDPDFTTKLNAFSASGKLAPGHYVAIYRCEMVDGFA